MHYSSKNVIVISLGGSVAFPDGMNLRFIRKFQSVIESFIKKGKKIIIVVGGGGICRAYQRTAAEIAPITNNDKDWIGIYATRLNASFVKSIFGKHAYPFLIQEPGKIKKLLYPVTFAGGWKPGWSTDFMAAMLAADVGAKEIVNIGKPAFVYDKNPDAHTGAKPFLKLRWKEYRKMVPRKWIPGFHAPVDPVAAKFCEARKLMMFVVGADLKNLARLLKGEKFKGTMIQ